MFQVEDSWVVTPCSVLMGYQRFRGSCCLHLQGEVADVGGNGIDTDPNTTPFTLKMKAALFSETLVFYYKTTWRHNTKEFDL
jgi:hypothetical protein